VKQVLDSRFLVEYLYSEDDGFRRKVVRKMKELANKGEGLIPTIVVCEIVQLVCSREGKDKADLIYLSLVASGIKFSGLTPSIAKDAGVLKSAHKNVPIGDCIVAATAIACQAKIVSDDPHFDLIQETRRVWI
jgi:predicted nucleic acid-binding protein